MADVLSQAARARTTSSSAPTPATSTDLEEAGLNPEAFEDGGGQRSDTMLLLRFADGGAKMMSIPRDLYVADRGDRRLGQDQRRLQRRPAPAHPHDPAGARTSRSTTTSRSTSSASPSLVDSLGGVTIEFPNPAFDRNSGLDVQQAGPGRSSTARRRSPSCGRATTSRWSTAAEQPDRHRRPRPRHSASSSSSPRCSASSASRRTRSRSPGPRAASPAGSGSTTASACSRPCASRWRLRGVDPEPVRAAHRHRPQQRRLGAVPRRARGRDASSPGSAEHPRQRG